MKNTCAQCGYCCGYITIALDTPEDFDDYDEIVWFLMHKDTKVYIDEDDSEGDEWYIEIKTPCKKQRDDGLCGIYETRPDICREYDAEECDNHGEGSPYKVAWETREEFIDYLKNKGIDYIPGQKKPEEEEDEDSETDEEEDSDEVSKSDESMNDSVDDPNPNEDDISEEQREDTSKEQEDSDTQPEEQKTQTF